MIKSFTKKQVKNKIAEFRKNGFVIFDDVIKKIKGRNVEKLETFKLVNDVVCKKFENIE